MKRILFSLLFALLPLHAFAQVVAQGAAGSAPWKVTFSAVPQPIYCTSGCGSPPATPDLDDFTQGVTSISAVGGVFTAEGFGDIGPTLLKTAAVRITKQRAFHVNFRDNEGASFGVDGNPIFVTAGALSPLPITGTVWVAQQTGIFVSTPSVIPWQNQLQDASAYGDAGFLTVSEHAAHVKVTGGGNTMTVSAAGAAKVDGSAVTQPVSAASLPLPTGAATAAGQADVKSGQTAGAINVCQFDQPGTFPSNHDYTTARCGQFREVLVRLLSSNGSTLGEPGSVYPLTTMFPAGNSSSTASFTANSQTQTYGSSSADSTSKGAIVFHVTNTFVGTIEFRGRTSSADSFTAVPAVNLTTGVAATTTTTTGFYALPSSYLWETQLATTAWTSGQADITTSSSPQIFANVLAAPVNITALPLPAGSATSALQTTGNSSLSSIDGKTPSLGQALAAASVPVILPAATITTLTPPAAITGFATSAIQATQQTALDAIKLDADKIPAQGQALAAASMPVVLTAIQTAALTPPSNTGYALDSSLTTLNAKDFATQATLALIKAKTDNLDALLSTLATQVTLAALNAKILADQQTMINSLSVTIASNQTPILTAPVRGLPSSLPCNPLRRVNCQTKGF